LATTAIHYVLNGQLSDASDVNQFADILTGVTNAPGITVNSLTVNGTPINVPTQSIQAAALVGVITASGNTANNISIAGSNAGSPVTITATGSDSAIGITAITKTTGAFLVSASNGTNSVSMTGAASGSSPTIAAVGTDPNIDLTLGVTGTGVINTAYAVTALGGGSTATLGTIGGSGPATLTQNSWLKIKINGTVSFIPVWR
jgi:hypothetical protein